MQHFQMSKAQAERVIKSLNAEASDPDVSEQNKARSLALIKSLEDQLKADQQFALCQTIDQINKELQQKGHNYYVIKKSLGREMEFHAPDASGRERWVGNFPINTSVEVLLKVNLMLRWELEKGQKLGRKAMAESFRQLIGAAPDPDSSLNDD